ncbi:RES family NAD+ phosphorylase [Flagellimonas sp.]|uniref:RES family NAD+ phosphorylase n=1 Tax=Flagellimonas sp. TaxID=2058762 RepID=UPI003AB87292
MIWSQKDIIGGLKSYRNTLYRYVEDQGPETTLLLVDNADEHEILEAALEETKPEFPSGVPVEPAYYLLTSPFRYQTEEYGSRFREVGAQDGVLYASENVQTALYEFTAWRLEFFLDSPEAPPTSAIPAISFSFVADHQKMIDLREEPFSSQPLFTSKTDYSTCQLFAAKARECETGIILYQSVRDPEVGANAALLDWGAIVESPEIPTGKPIRLIFKSKVVLVTSGPRDEVIEIPHEQLLEDGKKE